MAWEDIDLYEVPQLVAAADITKLKGNIEYLNRPSAATYQHPGTGANYTVTGTLGEDVDSTNFALSITTSGRRNSLVVACFYGQATTSGGAIRFNIVRTDNVSHIGRNLFYNMCAECADGNTQGNPVSGFVYFPGLPAGTHEFKLIWGVITGTGTLLVGYKPRMSVWEL